MTTSVQAPTKAEMIRADITAFAYGTVCMGLGIADAAGGISHDIVSYVFLAVGALFLLADRFLFGSIRRGRELYEDRIVTWLIPVLVASLFGLVAQQMRPNNLMSFGVIVLVFGTALMVNGLSGLRGRKDADAR